MKIKENGFKPITITLENQEEINLFRDLLLRQRDQTLEDVKKEEDWSGEYLDKLDDFDQELYDLIDSYYDNCDGEGDC